MTKDMPEKQYAPRLEPSHNHQHGMESYYAAMLSAQSLKKCYDIATKRVKQYLESEIQHLLNHVERSTKIIELGCGYGRVLFRIVTKAAFVCGIDNARASLDLAKENAALDSNCEFALMDVSMMALRQKAFDIVAAVQNGISAFAVEPRTLLAEAARITADRGVVLLSTYSPRFWEPRLEWFEIQAREGLLGEIDTEQTTDGIIVCKDGFKSSTFTEEQFAELADSMNLKATIQEVDSSSIFCRIDISHSA